MADQIDNQVLFSALHSELSARIIARTSINIAHLQTIVVFAAAFLTTKASSFLDPKLNDLSYFLSAIIPMISYYFVSLYQHNDMQIGLLNKCLRKIEDMSALLQTEVRFYKVGGHYAISFDARRYSHMAVFALCFASPFLIAMESIYSSKMERLIFRSQTTAAPGSRS